MMHLDQQLNNLNVNHIYQNQLNMVGDQNKNCAANLSNIIRSISNSGNLPANYQLYTNLNKLQLASNNQQQLNNYQQNVQNLQNFSLQNGVSSTNSQQQLQQFSADLLNQQQQLQNFHQHQNLSSPMTHHLLNGNNAQLPLQPKQLPQNNVLCNPKFNQSTTHSTPSKYQQMQNNLYNNTPSSSSNHSSTFGNHHLHHTKSAASNDNNGHSSHHQFFNPTVHQTNAANSNANLQTLQQQQIQLYLQINNQNNPNILNRNLINSNLISRNLFNLNNQQQNSTDSGYYNSLPSTPSINNKSALLNNNNNHLISASTLNRTVDQQFVNSSFTFNSNGSGGSLSSNKSNSSGSDNMSTNHSNDQIEISGQLKNFKILKQIGNGQFSTVYKAAYTPTGQCVALKCIRILELDDMKTRLDCINEISLLQRLDHQNIIKFYTSFVEHNELYIVLELADCGDLAQLIKHFRKVKKSIPEKRIWSYFTQIANGLIHMHENTILHRDIKPPNVFITQHGVVKLGDLGLSKYYGANCKGNCCCCNGPGFCLSNKEKNNNANIDTRAVLENHFNTILSQKNIKNSTQTSNSLSNLVKACTQQVRNNINDHKSLHYKYHKHLMQDEASSLIGTPFYMSKERLSENCKYDSQSDIWSLGCILYEMAALQSPFYGEKLNLISLCQKIVSCNYPPLADTYSVALRALVASCLDSDPKRRPDIMLICDIAKFCSELCSKELQIAHLLSPMFKTLKVDEILSNDKLNAAKMSSHSISPIKNNLYSLNLNSGLNRNNNSNKNNNNNNNYNDSSMTNLMNNQNLNQLANCVPNQMLVQNNNMMNNFFNTTNDSNYTNDLQSLDSENTQDSFLKFWKSDPENEKNFI